MAYGKFTGNLRGTSEHIWRRGWGAIGHIIVNYDDIFADLTSDAADIRIETWCGKNYKHGENSSIDLRNHVVRNACEYCFVEYDPDERSEESRNERDRRKSSERESYSDLPF